MIEINLLPEVKLQYVRAQKARRRVISFVSIGGIAAVGLVALFAVYVYAVQPVRGLVIDNGIKDANSKLTSVKDLNNYLTIQQQLKDLPELHAGKPIYSRIISYLPILNPSAPNNIHVTQLAIDTSVEANALTIQAYASTYTAATVFESTLKSTQFSYTADGQTQTVSLFSDVKLSNTSLGQDSNGNKIVAFTVMLKIDENAFAFASTNASISVPNKNATGSAQSVPEVFANTTGGGAQ